ncbi:hypothetical protein K1719_033713 [Acacia pycnantha]|nr:hypothetical protein K1719_033713 [Acacia pycnantha]
MWLQQHGSFDAVVDGANVSLANTQHFSVLQQLQQMSPSKRLPLAILHMIWVTIGSVQKTNNNRLLEYCKKSNALCLHLKVSMMTGNGYMILLERFSTEGAEDVAQVTLESVDNKRRKERLKKEHEERQHKQKERLSLPLYREVEERTRRKRTQTQGKEMLKKENEEMEHRKE